MNTSFPTRFVDDRLERVPEPPQARSGLVLAVVLAAVFAAVAAVTLSTPGFDAACGQDWSGVCTTGAVSGP